MLESLVATILNRFLGNYVSNLNYDQLKIGIWNGEVNLKNLKLRREALDKLDLPIDVLEGYFGELTLSIPWANLKTKPVKVFVDHVYLLAVPKSEVSVSAEEEDQRAQLLKQRRLATAELMEDSQVQDDQTKKGDDQSDGFMGQLTTKIIDNLQLSIKNIHVRYEDNLSDPGHPFACGITLKELSAVSTDGEFKPTFISEMTNTIHKASMATLQSLSVYWNTDSPSLSGLSQEDALKTFTELIPSPSNASLNHQYILKPVSGTGKIKLNKKFDNKVAKTDVTLLFDELAFSLDDDQYRDAILMVDLFHANLKKQKYRKYHPVTGTPKSNPRAYLKFAGDAVLAEIHDRNYRWSWESFRKRRDERKAYIECYTAVKKQKATPEQQEELERLERLLSFEDIRFYRSIAKSRIRRSLAKLAEEKKNNQKENKGWFGSWWSGEAKPEQETDDTSLVMTEEQKRELYDAIEYNEESDTIAAAIDMPMDTMKFSLGTKLNRGSFSLLKHSKKKTKELAALVFDTVTVDLVQYVESVSIAGSLGDLQVHDGQTKGTLYPQWVGVKKSDGKSILDPLRKETSKSLISLNDPNESSPFFSFEFQHKPLSKVADNALSLTMRHLEIIYNPTVINGIVDFFKPPSTKMESVNALMEAAGDTIESFKQQTRAGLEYALDKHTTISLDINMAAPLLVIPESCFCTDSAALIIDAGHINVDSDLASQELANQFKAKGDKKYSEEDYLKLEGLMYDKFHVQLTQTKVLIGTNLEECLEQLYTKAPTNKDAHLLEKIDMNLLVELCILPGITQFTKFKVSANLPLLSVNFSDSKYKTMMRMLDVVLPPSPAPNSQEVSILSTEPQSNKQITSGQDSDRGSNVLSQKLWGDKNKELLVHGRSRAIGSAENSDTDEDDGSVAPENFSTASMIPMVNTKQEQFKFSFKVDKVSVAINQTEKDYDTLLAEFVLEHFDFCFLSRPYDMQVELSLKTLCVIDKMEHGNEFNYLITSDTMDRYHQSGTENERELVHVKYHQVNRKHPLYHDTFGGYDQTIDVALSTLNIIVTRSSILTLYNWVLSTFTGPPSPQNNTPETSDESMHILSSALSSDQVSVAPKKPAQDATMKVNIQLESLDLILNDDGKRLGTGELSSGSLCVSMLPKTMHVSGKFGNFTLSDDREHSNVYDLSRGASNVHILSVLGDGLMDFTFETFDPKSDTFPGYDQKLYMRMGSFQFLLTESTKPVMEFLSEFLAMKTVYDTARTAAFETAQQIQETSSRFHFDVTIQSPVVVFPVGENPVTDRITARLGEIRAINEFKTTTRHSRDGSGSGHEVSLNLIQCGLYSISLKSTAVIETENGQEVRELPIINDLKLAFDVESLEKPGEDTYGPATQILGRVSDVRMSLTERQFKSLLDVSELLTATFAGGSEPEAAVEDVPQPSKSVPTTPSVSVPAISQTAKNAQSEKQVQIDLAVSVKTISLEILHGPDLSYDKRNDQALARIALNDLGLKLQTMTDSMMMELNMQSMCFTDTRPNSVSLFREIIPVSGRDGPQLQVKVKSLTQQDSSSIMDVGVVLDSPRVVLSLDYLLLLKDFFMAPFDAQAAEMTTEAQEYAKTQRNRLSNGQEAPVVIPTDSVSSTQIDLVPVTPPPKQVLNYNVNVVDVEIICLAKPDLASSEAVVFSFDQLKIVQNQRLDFSVESIGMLLCHMDNREYSSVDFVETFDVNMSMESSLPSPGHNITVIKLDVNPILLRLSYHDAMLILEIINKATELMGNAQTIEETDKENINLVSSDSHSAVVLSDPACPTSDSSPRVPTSSTLVQKPVQKIEPYIVLSKESLVANFEGLQLTLIEDLHDLPFIDWTIQPFTINAKDWSRSLEVNVDFSMYANNFNFKISHWEPILEPWEFTVKVNKDAAVGTMHIRMSSETPLNINVTHAFLESALAVSETLDKIQPLPENAQDFKRPYLIRNCTGYDIKFWNMSDDATKQDTNDYMLKNNEEKPWTFRDAIKRRERSNLGKNYLGVQVLHAGWEKLLHLPMDQEGEVGYRLKPELDEISHRLVVDIKLENNVKTVTFRSGLLLHNQTKSVLEAQVVSYDMKPLCASWKLEPSEKQAVPIELAFNNWITVRPSEEYEWSNKLYWSDIMNPKFPKDVFCKSINSAKPDYIIQLSGKFDKNNNLCRQYPLMVVGFGAPIQIDNFLPFDYSVSLVDKQHGENVSVDIKAGGSAYLHKIKSTSILSLKIAVQSELYTTSEMVTIETKPYQTLLSSPLILNTHTGNQITLGMNITRLTGDNDSLWISIFPYYMILNITGRPIALKARMSAHQKKAVVENIRGYTDNSPIVPYLFSYHDVDRHNRALLSIDGSKFSDDLSFEAIGSALDVTLPVDNQSVMHAGVRVEEGTGKYKLTKIVTISPRFIIANRMSHNVKFRQFGPDEKETPLAEGAKESIYQTNKSELKWLCLQLENLHEFWSAPIDIQEIGTTHLKLSKGDSSHHILVRVTVHLQQAILFITLEEADEWPYKILNNSKEQVKIYQENTVPDDYHLKTKQRDALGKQRHFTLEPDTQMDYSWDFPIAKKKHLILEVNGKTRTVDFQAIGSQIPFQYKKPSTTNGDKGACSMSIDVVAKDSALVLVLTQFDPMNSLYRAKSIAASSASTISKEGTARDYFEEIDVEHVINFTFELSLERIGISIINKQVRELIFTTIKGLDFKYSDSNLYQSVRCSVKWLQIDNQLQGSAFPILFYPSNLPKDTNDTTVHPTLHVSLYKTKDTSHGVMYFKLFSFLLQEVTFEMDEDLLFALIEFSKFSVPKDESEDDSLLFIQQIPEPESDQDQALYYFEEFCIQPMRLNISFVRTERISSEESDDSGHSPLNYVFNVFTMTLGNINDAPIKLNALVVENMRVSYADLTSRVMFHYQEQVMYQLHRVLGSADFLGNPVGLFTNLSSGFGELFYEPYQGFVMSDRPQDLGIGIARGVGGFMKKSVFGVSDSMSKFTGSLGKGLSAATMDKKFQDRRRMNLTRNKPKHAMYGVTQGVAYLGTSVASGFVGLVKRPMEGAEESGFGGFMSGVGRGLVGVVTKPVVGIFDLASNVTAGIRETTTVFDESEFDRERLPRYIGKDNIVKAFSQREALGQMWLREANNGKYFHDTYIAHCVMKNDEMVAILSYQRILVIQTRKLSLEWQYPLEEIESCVPTPPDQIVLNIFIRSQSPPKFKRTIDTHDTVQVWFSEKIQEIIDWYKEEKERN
ncbi:hypothetical protein CLU79DRAFT_890124 [Phycomyces nitens]|nr:hypothetical protein CLU79DRAFT_890124 [Phycomyces nitens]